VCSLEQKLSSSVTHSLDRTRPRVLYINSLRPSRSSGFRTTRPGANRRVEFPVPSLWAKLLEEIRLRHSSTERRPEIPTSRTGSGPGPVQTMCDRARQLLLQRTPTEGSYQQSLFGKFLVWSLLILGTVAVQDYRTSLEGAYSQRVER
jgi:hypothetical protein